MADSFLNQIPHDTGDLYFHKPILVYLVSCFCILKLFYVSLHVCMLGEGRLVHISVGSCAHRELEL